MKDVYILAVESSCDETSIAIVKNGHEVISCVVLSQMDTHALNPNYLKRTEAEETNDKKN